MYTMEYYLAMRKNDIWPFVATWMYKPYRERQIPYVFTLMWIMRNLTEDHGGGEGKKWLEKEGAKT